MSNNSSSGRATSVTSRGDRTREVLLDALEAIVAEDGLSALSHRAIARRAHLHTGLIHYHFGTVERLLEEALARRAARLSRAQLAALSALVARGHWTVEDVVAALWLPFAAVGAPIEGGWRNYLCLVARLASETRGEGLLARHFQDVVDAARQALRRVLPDAGDDALTAGLRFVRTLLDQEVLARCRRATPERSENDDGWLIAFASAGLRGLAAERVQATVPLRAALP